MRLISLLTIVLLLGCTTRATISEDGRELVIKGIGEAKFENGASIKGKPLIEIPTLPNLEIDK